MSRAPLLGALLLLPLAAFALDDPMRPPMAAARAPRAVAVESGFVLSSTTIARERRIAVINGTRVAEGERIGAAQVLEILPTQVRLRQGEKDVVVRLVPVSVKTPANDNKQEQQ